MNMNDMFENLSKLPLICEIINKMSKGKTRRNTKLTFYKVTVTSVLLYRSKTGSQNKRT